MKKIFTSLFAVVALSIVSCFTVSCKDDDDDKETTEVLNEKDETDFNEKEDDKNNDIVVVDKGALVVASYKVSDSKSVYFSQGNLQFNVAQGTHATADGGTAQGTWRFAENQYDYIGDANSNVSSVYDGWIDLFGWGTSGWNSGAIAYRPWTTQHHTRIIIQEAAPPTA